MLEKLKVAVFDDHPLFREGVVQTLQGENDIEVVGEGASAVDAFDLVTRELPQIALLDVNMPGGGLEAARRISAVAPVVKIVMLTASESEAHVTEALEAGACGYILKGVGGSDLVRTLRSVQLGERYVTPTLAASMLSGLHRRAAVPEPGPQHIELTTREEQILEQVSVGKTNKEIARTFELSEKTVKHYVTNILQKLQVRNRVEAALSFERTKRVTA